MRIIVVGGSAAGQFTALLLARAGHEVVLLDRDPVEPASGIEAAASAFRPAVDAIVFRAFWRVMGMLARPDDVYTDPDVVARTRDVLRSLGTVPAMTQPTRAQLQAALA